MNNMLCIECNKYIHGFKYNTRIYRCGDANVCSKLCSIKRYNKLEIIDPHLASPLSWTNTQKNYIKKTKSTCSFYQETISEIGYQETISEIGDIEDINIDPVYEEYNNYDTITQIFSIIYDVVYKTLVRIILLTK